MNSPLVGGQPPNVSHLRLFGYATQVPIALPQCTKLGLQRHLDIYVGFDSPSIIRYLEPLTGDIFKARLADCHFDETTFQPLGGAKLELKGHHEITWHTLTLSHLDSRTN